MVKTQADLEPLSTQGSRIVSKILSPAIRLWLRSQVESVGLLKFQVNGSDRQILGGCIPSVTVTAEQVVYQGLHLSHLHLAATQIRINFGQVLKGKPLRLMEIVPVAGEVALTQADLNASASTPLLRQALAEILKTILQRVEADSPTSLVTLTDQPIELHDPTILLQADRLTLICETDTTPNLSAQITLNTALQLIGPSQLQLTELELLYTPAEQAASRLFIQPFQIDLGPDVNLHQLKLEPERLLCQGQINVNPE